MTAHRGRVWPGKPFPLGATFDGEGVNFAVFSEHATKMAVSIFDPVDHSHEVARLVLPERTDLVWHGYVHGLRAGTLYGFRAHGPWEPVRGFRFNAQKLLVDPCARAIHGKVIWRYPVHGHDTESEDKDLDMDDRDSAMGVPKSVVLSDHFDWEGDRPPQTRLRESVVYEIHVKGFTQRHPAIPEALRGTYSGLAHPAAIEHLKSLGVTAVELLPVHETVDDGFLVEKGLRNYWGYSTLGYFAPDQRFSSRGNLGGQVAEFKEMVKALHRAGIEVILDVVYNHTCEGNHLGPTLSLRGLDNTAYYWLRKDEPRYYLDFTGTGNSLNMRHPQAVKLVCDSLRYWVQEMHVDGFRFDLATTLARNGEGAFDRHAPFLSVLHQDPVLSTVKLIAEPWDLALGGYQLANFPPGWAEWNGKYRDTMRRFWKGDDRQLSEVGWRLTGSSDQFQLSGRRPQASINFVTCHDGFTLDDLVSYNQKHNEANREENRDGTNQNDSWNGGVEGPTDDPKIVRLREKQKRNFIASLMVSQGVPMLNMGDEVSRSQHGNNNAYCQDNEISWMSWEWDARQRALLEFTKKMIRLKLEEPVLQRRKFFQGAHIWDSELKDIAWFRVDGKEMAKEDWEKPGVHFIGMLLGGDAIPTPDEQGNRVVGDTLLVLMNAHPEPQTFTLPAIEWGKDWEIVADTADVSGEARPLAHAGGRIEVLDRSMIILRRPALM
ncbi:MAG TPA: glycogen debranching protein GlgX [Myxococcaceae bacterium]|nr:glycogen debranching protein GlgX [Myxococcaceae bacterium]